MQSRFEIEKAEDTPWVILDKEKNEFEIGGRSLPENSDEFYTPVKQWLKDYANEPNPLTQFNCKLEYFNSSSARRLIEIFILLKDISSKQHAVKVNWFCENEDFLLKKKAHEMLSLIDLPHEIISVE